MALKNNFYNEIFEKEQKWIELINSKLLNSIYCNLTLKPFYVEKKNQLKTEYDLNNNAIIGQILTLVDNIINQIDLLNSQYKNNMSVDIESLLPLFLTTQMSNTSRVEKNVSRNVEINRLQLEKNFWKMKLKIIEKILIILKIMYMMIFQMKKIMEKEKQLNFVKLLFFLFFCFI